MATYLIGNNAYQSASHQPGQSLPAVVIGIKAIFRALVATYRQGNAARHLYEGMVAHEVPRSVAARRTFEYIFSDRAPR